MENSLYKTLLKLVEDQVKNSKTEEEKKENIQLLKELRKEKENCESEFSDSFFWSLLKNVATHEVIEFLKEFMSG